MVDSPEPRDVQEAPAQAELEEPQEQQKGWRRSERFAHLPERIAPADMVPTHAASPPSDPEGGRDSETEFMIRYGGG